jgi:hypothetical protein
MPFSTATKKELLNAIFLYCHECMGAYRNPKECTRPNCRLYPHRLGWVKAPDQYHALKVGDPAVFYDTVVMAARKVRGRPGGFTMSDVREQMPGVEPLNPSWWGNATKSEAWRLVFVGSTDSRKSSTEKRKCGRSQIWFARNGV